MSNRGKKDNKLDRRVPVIAIDNDNDEVESVTTSFKFRPASPEPNLGFISTAPSPHSKNTRKRDMTEAGRNDPGVFKKPKHDLIPAKIPSVKEKKDDSNLYANQMKRERFDGNNTNKPIQFASPKQRNKILDFVGSPSKKGKTPSKRTRSDGLFQLTSIDPIEEVQDLLEKEETIIPENTSSSQLDVYKMENMIDLQQLLDKENNINREVDKNSSEGASNNDYSPPNNATTSSKTLPNNVDIEDLNHVGCNGKSSDSKATNDDHQVQETTLDILDHNERLELELRKQRWQMCTLDEWKTDGLEIIDEFAELIRQVQERVTSKIDNMTDFINRIKEGKIVLKEQKHKLDVSKEEVNEATKSLILKKKYIK